MSGLIERQVIVTWEDPRERLPKEGHSVPVTISGTSGSNTYDHALVLGEWFEGEGWYIVDVTGVELIPGKTDPDIEVLAWADLTPYGYKEV